MAKRQHELLIIGQLEARCSCGQWKYVGMMPEAKRAIADVHFHHKSFQELPPRRKSKKGP